MFRRIPGTKDILPEEISGWQRIEAISRHIFSLYNYQQIRLPIIEETGLFQRSLGESADIVQKQMFLVGSRYALRPEGTASVARAYIENNLAKTNSFIKLYYIGPMFRCERPQKGRLRQFHHLGCEAIGSKDADLDIEVISLADNLLKNFSIDGYKIKINSLGCREDKKALTQSLRKSLEQKLTKFCLECRRRFKLNTLRILDCKNEGCIEELRKSDIRDTYLCSECKGHFSQVKQGLDTLKIDYELVPYLVRGLDYYTRTVFELTHQKLGSQDALGAGGRYDTLVKELGGPDIGAIGFALGMERLRLVTSDQLPVNIQNLVYIISIGDEARKESLKILDNLRKNSVTSDTDYENKSLKGALRKANDLKARFVLIVGEDELKKCVVTLKDMVSGEQKEIIRDNLITELKSKL